ncbi:hypothetical protein DK419_01225 [Methylobacterium terrae]|uniref:Transposase IS204/IS1001/IS1096/IS1165 DDE domain-containing protein n=1 Tax=Methylobacterium terrae TaxID=2202827 RepID=A0A2U8WI86_9HYPH|nr:hypothetical protein DK419_01225 [Methylobacterium terrae]
MLGRGGSVVPTAPSIEAWNGGASSSRCSAPVRNWLVAHPSVAVVSRDRAGPYAEAARTGAPAARQVADRRHLIVNASEALHAIVERHQSDIRTVAGHPMPEPSLSPDRATTKPVPETGRPRRDRCEAALRLDGGGPSTKEIARPLAASRDAARRWIRAGQCVGGSIEDPPWLAGAAAAAGPAGSVTPGSPRTPPAPRPGSRSVAPSAPPRRAGRGPPRAARGRPAARCGRNRPRPSGAASGGRRRGTGRR